MPARRSSILAHSPHRRPVAWVLTCALALVPVATYAAAATPRVNPGGKAADQTTETASRIVAVVNGDVISNVDINNRARLFAMSTGMPMSQDIIDRLKPQILRQLVDEKLRFQEAQRRKIVIPDAQIADAIKEIEARNNMQPGALRAKLTADGISFRTLVDQVRTQLAWTQVLRDSMAERVQVTPAEVAEQQKLLEQMVGKTEYRLGEIFIPVDDPANAADAERFAETVIKELHAGAAFPLVAAQFSQTQSALEGGQIGWVQPNELDPAVAQIVQQMPVGAISNPVRVPGGISIVALEAKRDIGREMATVVTVRQAFIAFSTPLTDPQHPTDQQREALAKARQIGSTVNGCAAMEQAAKSLNGSHRPVDPGEINVASVSPPAFKQLLETIPIGKPTEPLISRDGIAVLTVCTRDEKNVGQLSAEDIQRHLLEDRVDLLSRQMLRDLRRKASIDMRGLQS